MKNTVENIAKRYLFLGTLETRNSDQLDIKEQAVWNIKTALEEAYIAGQIAGLTRALDLYDTTVKRIDLLTETNDIGSAGI
jgi:hypothetical protein